MDIYFSDLAREEIYQLSCLPSTMPELSKSAKNEEFETYSDGIYNIIGNKGLTTFSIDCWLPEYPKKYNWAKSQLNPYKIINLWENAMTKKVPLRCVLIRGDNGNNISPIILDWAVSVENYSQIPNDEFGDLKYKIELKEYRDMTPQSVINNVKKTVIESASMLEKLKDILKK
ncbi:hypothetical protein [Clostridium sp.]|uniref:hypothetical protein n=1 Tax=Clostridium sp. TaxID=1506 RepID=UPI002FDCA3BF